MSNDRRQKLLTLIREAVHTEEVLRKKYQIGNKFRFVRDQLHTLLEEIELKFKNSPTKEFEIKQEILPDEILVYVYLYNVHGSHLRSWSTLLVPDAFYEYSVNRPIYSKKEDIAALLRSKKNKLHHGYLTIAVKKNHIIQSDHNLKDSIGLSLQKVKEGSLHFDKLVTFTHNEHDYFVDEEGNLIKKM